MTIPIAEAVDLIIDHRGRPTPTLSASGVQFVSAKNVFGGRLRLDVGQRFLSHEFAAEWIRHEIKPGDVLLTSEAPLGEVAYFDGRAEICVGQRLFGLRARADVLDSRFLYYLLQSPEVRRRIRARASGTTAQGIKQSELRRVELDLPPLAEQRQISFVLGALDDKIDSNRRLAALLEKVAATLFTARFADFIGVEDFDESEIGPIPTGWRVGSLTDIAQFVNGKAFTKYANGLGLPIIRIRELNGGIDGSTPASDIDAAEDNIAHFGDILFAWSGSLDVYGWTGDDALINQHIFKVIPRRYPTWFVYGWIRHHMASFQAAARDRAVTMGHIRRHHLEDAQVPLPPPEEIRSVSVTLDPVDAQARALIAESNTLTQIRDALLPKLMSGEIKVSITTEAVNVLEAVA